MYTNLAFRTLKKILYNNVKYHYFFKFIFIEIKFKIRYLQISILTHWLTQRKENYIQMPEVRASLTDIVFQFSNVNFFVSLFSY
jgi:hypothetical protein